MKPFNKTTNTIQKNQLLKSVHSMSQEEKLHAIEEAACCAQEDLISELLEEPNIELHKNAIRSAAIAKHYTLVFKLIDKYVPSNVKNKCLTEAKYTAGFNGDKVLAQQLLNRYNSIGFRHLDLEPILLGAISGKQISYVLELLDRGASRIQAINAATILKKFEILDHILNKNPGQNDYIYIVSCLEIENFKSADDLILFLSSFNSLSIFDSIYNEISKQNRISKDLVLSKQNIKIAITQSIELQNIYNLSPRQALPLVIDPTIKTLILDQQYQPSNLVPLLQDRTLLDSTEVQDLITKVRSNQLRAELIDSLTTYTLSNSGWWRNHNERAKSLLDEIKCTRDQKSLQTLVSSQLSLFSNKPAVIPVNSNKPHTRPLKNTALKDGYYNALMNYANKLL